MQISKKRIYEIIGMKSEYIAKCPNARCGYYGQLPVVFQDNESIMKQKIVHLEQKYPLYRIPVKTYAPISQGLVAVIDWNEVEFFS